MPTVNLKDINPAVFLHNMGLSSETPDEKLVIRGGNLKFEHDNVGEGIKFKSSVAAGNKSSISWIDSNDTEKWRLINDESANRTDDLRLISSSITALTVKQDGKISIGSSTVDSTSVLTINSAFNADTYLSFKKGGLDGWRVGPNNNNNFVISQGFAGLGGALYSDVLSMPSGGASVLFDVGVGVGLPSAEDILAQRASSPTSTTVQQLTVKGEARFFQDDPYNTGMERGIVLSWDMDDNTGVIDTTDATTKLEFDIGGNMKYILEDAGTAGASAGTEGWIKVRLGGTLSNPVEGYIRVYTAK